MNTSICTVCSKNVSASMQSFCGSCGKLFHLNQKSDLTRKDCGEVWLDEERIGLMFRCANCTKHENIEGTS